MEGHFNTSALWLRTSCFNSWSLGFLVCRIGMQEMLVPALILLHHQGFSLQSICVSPAEGFLQPQEHAWPRHRTNQKCLRVSVPGSSFQPITNRIWWINTPPSLPIVWCNSVVFYMSPRHTEEDWTPAAHRNNLFINVSYTAFPPFLAHFIPYQCFRHHFPKELPAHKSSSLNLLLRKPNLRQEIIRVSSF